MAQKRRASRIAHLSLEQLDARVVPATTGLGSFGSEVAAFASTDTGPGEGSGDGRFSGPGKTHGVATLPGGTVIRAAVGSPGASQTGQVDTSPDTGDGRFSGPGKTHGVAILPGGSIVRALDVPGSSQAGQANRFAKATPDRRPSIAGAPVGNFSNVNRSGAVTFALRSIGSGPFFRNATFGGFSPLTETPIRDRPFGMLR